MVLLLLLFLKICNIAANSTVTTTTAVEYELTNNTVELDISPTNVSEVDLTTTCNFNDSSCVGPTSPSTTLRPKSFTTRATTPAIAPTSKVSVKTEAGSFKNSDSYLCTCDLRRNFCDINCCCDQDCSFESKKVFRACKAEPNFNSDTSFCQYMDHIYLNNTPYKWEVNQNGLFCIAKSNLPARYTLQRNQPITELEDAAQQKRNKYSWPERQTQPEPLLNASDTFKYGDSVWIIRNGTLEVLEMPDGFVTSACLVKQKMKFLQNFKSRCSQTKIGENNPSLNANTYFRNVSVLRAPRYFNASVLGKRFENCPKNVCLPLEAHFCSDNFEKCVTAASVLNRTSVDVSCRLNTTATEHFCSNLVQNVKYNLHHYGTSGFTRAEVFIVLSNASHHATEFPQEFSVSYFWTNYSFSYSSLLSGNPGYQVHKPILIGNLVNTATPAPNKKLYSLKVQRDPLDVSDNFLVFPASRKGACVLNNQTNLLAEFGYNMILKCSIRKEVKAEGKNVSAKELCRRIQQEVFAYWPVSRKNLSDINMVVGNFGNANQSVLSDWTKILSNKTPAQILNETAGSFSESNATLLCQNLVGDLRVEIFHGRVDFKELLDQERIYGVMYSFGGGRNLRFGVEGGRVFADVLIREEVVFFDMTGEKVQKFADPPSFRIALPYDFFYPFVRVGSGAGRIASENLHAVLLGLHAAAVRFIVVGGICAK